jgi:hypothetical protein
VRLSTNFLIGRSFSFADPSQIGWEAPILKKGAISAKGDATETSDAGSLANTAKLVKSKNKPENLVMRFEISEFLKNSVLNGIVFQVYLEVGLTPILWIGISPHKSCYE